jgi:hypothetical protein
MKTYLKIIFTLIIFLIVIGQKPTFAIELADHSATLVFFSPQPKEFLTENDLLFKAKALEEVLSLYQSPLKNETENFIKICQKYNLNCYLLPAIAGLESSFGQFIYPNSYNPFGWGGGYIIFNSWSDAIETVAKGLRNNYLNKGALTIEQIGSIYSESPTWSRRINWFLNQFEQKENEIRLRLFKNQVKL